MKAEKYFIVTEASTAGSEASTVGMKTRYGFGAAGEEVQKLLAMGAEKIRVKIDGTTSETIFTNARPWRLLDIKQRIKGLSVNDD